MDKTSPPVAIITAGAGLGIGHGITEALADAGWAVVIADRGRERSQALADRLKTRGCQVETVILDMTEPDAPEKTVRAAIKRFGRLDGLVNNVGVGLTKPIGDVSDEEFFKLFNVDFLASFRYARAALPELIKTSGSIINIGSVHSKLGAPKFGLYASTKAALDGFARGLAVDYGKHGIRANNVHPGLVDSPQNESLIANLVPDAKKWLREFALTRQCIPRLATAREVGELVQFLMSEKGRSITGQSIFIDGGTTTLLWNNE
jgi:L-fucose dehydrogenase